MPNKGGDNLDSVMDEHLSLYLNHFVFEPYVDYNCSSVDPNSLVVPRGHLTIDYIGAEFNKTFYLYSFLYSIVQKIMCDLKLTINFVSHPNQYYYYNTLLLDPIPLDHEGTKYGDIVATQQVYMVEMMTTVKKADSAKYFSFFHLFEFYVWLCLLVSIGVNVILWNLTNEFQISLIKALRYIMRTLTAQNINGFRVLMKNQSRNSWKRHKKSIFIMLLLLWMFMSATLQKCISSVLLISYLKLAPEPLFTGLTDVYNDKNAKFVGSIDFLPDDMSIKQQDEKQLKRKFLDMKEYPISVDNRDILKTIRLVLEGKAVILDDSYGMRQKEKLFQEINKLVVIEKKYAPTYITFFVNKNVTAKTEILELIQSGIESGLYWRYRLVEMIKVDARRIMLDIFNHDDYSSLLRSEDNKFALELKEIWRSVILILVLGYTIDWLVFLGEIIFQQYFQMRIEQKVNEILKTHSTSSFLYRILNNKRAFVKRAKRLKSLTFEPKEVHRKLRSNYKLYFMKS